MSADHYGLAPTLTLAPWDAPCTEDADAAAEERAALMAVEDADAVTWCAQ